MYGNRVFFFLVSLVLVGCGGGDDILKADKVVGYWQVEATNTQLLNGAQQSEFVEMFWVEFYDQNEGQFFDSNENPTTEIRWSYEERDDFDRMLIFYKLGGNNTIDLYTDEFNEVVKFKDNEFTLFSRREAMVGDSIFTTETLSKLKRQ